MYIAMNRFTVPEENAAAFEEVWLGRESKLDQMPGFVEFHMLRGSLSDDGTIVYASHTVWETETAFLDWTRSAAFRGSHKGAGQSMNLHRGTPLFEGFTTIQHIARVAG